MSSVHITLLGKEVLPAYNIIKSFITDGRISKGVKVYVLCTNESLEKYEQLRRILEYIGVDCEYRIVGAFDLSGTNDICEKLHENHGPDATYSYNLTGGTKIMAIGAMKVATKYNAEMYYTDSKHIIDINAGVKSDMNVNVSNDEIFILHGQIRKSFAVYEGDDKLLLKEADAIRGFINKCKSNDGYGYDVFKHLQGVFTTAYGIVPRDYESPNGIGFNMHGDGGFDISYNGEKLLDLSHEDAAMQLFEGRWFETLASDEIYKWSRGRYEIWTGVTFSSINESDAKNDKNEIDILVNVGNTLIFVECKSGKVDQNIIYKMNSIRQTYGSAKSKSLLMSYYKVHDSLKEKASESQIEIIDNLRYPKCQARIPSVLSKIVESLNI